MAQKHNEQMMYNWKHRSMEDFFNSDEWQRLNGENVELEDDRVIDIDGFTYTIQSAGGLGILAEFYDEGDAAYNNIYLQAARPSNEDIYAYITAVCNKTVLDAGLAYVDLWAQTDVEDEFSEVYVATNQLYLASQQILLELNTITSTLEIAGLRAYADDAAAAAGGIPINGVYRTASALKIRVA